MQKLRVSVVIPYRQRLPWLRRVLAALAEQTLPRTEFEVVVGAVDHCPEFLATCAEFDDRLTVVAVVAGGEWNVGRARNLALRQARGEVTVLLDADVALPPTALARLYDSHFAAGQRVCVLGRMHGYDARVEDDRDLLPFDAYRDVLRDLERPEGAPDDVRWRLPDTPLAWTLVWTGLVALPTADLHRHDLWFDEEFRVWGSEDQEWGLRVAEAGVPIVRGDGLTGLHLPHSRDVTSNYRALRDNKRYLLAKWPRLDVELYLAVNFTDANAEYPAVAREVADLAAPGTRLGVARGLVDGVTALDVGVVLDEADRIVDPQLAARFDGGTPTEVLPLVGLALPWPDGSVVECRLLPPIEALTPRYREAVTREARRVAGRVDPPPDTGKETRCSTRESPGTRPASRWRWSTPTAGPSHRPSGSRPAAPPRSSAT
ncbi:glycosyltransferase family 2 protein [Micromonospora sp. NPDC000207]|uniref:glycosyltransferase family 2 protein n=1 Tax=Micromonospora sp. NPDC000207 TaxID=3154246 RepID=UPI003323B3B2